MTNLQAAKPNNFHLLVIDDDTRLRTLLGRFLEESGFMVSLAKDTREAKELIQSINFDLMIVDVMLPNQNGIDFTSEFRKVSKVPIIMLTARGKPDDRIQGLESGADDYMQKPFEPKELLLRINNILKHVTKQVVLTQDSCIFGEFCFDYTTSRLKKQDVFIHLTESESKILGMLCRKKGNVVLRNELSVLYGEIDERSIDVQVTRLRRKIEDNPKQPKYLQTVRSRGYVLYG